ncbi:MAG: glycosyltransferase family A protein [Patescibacteria group bacterium]|jgi:glycosyltransferase involved in cell wall biosynthesis
MPKISIIIPAYNCASTIDKCLKSVFDQTFQDFEVIVINDGSKDGLNEVIKSWLNPPQPSLSQREGVIRYISQENQGAPMARNNGFAESTGEYVIFLDADIIMKPSMLAKLLKKSEETPDASYAYSSFMWGWKKFKLWPFNAEKLKQIPYIHTSALIKREDFPGFDSKLKKFQDWDLWLTMLEQGHMGIWVDEVLFRITSSGTMSSWLPSFVYKLPFIKTKNKDKYEKAMEIIKEKHNL